MEKDETESGNQEAAVQLPLETEEKKTGQAEISAITDVTTHERFEKLNIKTIIHHESTQYVNSNNNHDNQHIDFVLFTKRNNQAIIPEFSDESVKQFQASRIMVINYASKFDEIALQAAEKIAFEHDIKHNFKPICCSIHDHHSIKLDKLIRYAADDKTFNANQEQVLIVFEQRPEETSADFIAHLMKKGGPADIVSAGLRNKKLYLIYVCQNDKLFETRPFGQTHFGLYLIDPYVLAFYAAKSDAKFAMDDYLTAMNAIRMTGWLNDYPEEQKISVLTGLSCLGQLKTEADQQLKSIDKIQESKVVTGLMGEPVKNMILFIVAFFDGISLSEFDDLATTLLLTIPALQNDHLQTNASPSPLKDWHLRSDELLSDCGIYLDNTADKKVASYKFRMEIRREIVVELFRNKYRMALTRRQELIANQAVSQPLAYSRAYIDSWLKLFFETAALDPYRYLLGFALKLANLIIDEDETALNQDEKIRLQMMLIDCIGDWEDNDELNQSITKFYGEMKNSIGRRVILGNILAFHCAPNRPQMLKRLKTHLESISKEETLFNFDVINEISFNYLDNIPSLLETVMEWNEERTGKPLRSASHIRCAYLLLFYQQWPSKCSKGDLSYRVLKQLIPNKHGLEQLAGFVFGKGTGEAFKLLHIDKYRQKYETEIMLERMMGSHLYLMQAFMLIQWYYLFKLIRSDSPGAEWEVQDVFMICIREIAGATDMARLKSDVGRACSLLNYEIEEQMDLTEKTNTIQLLRQKRDGARELLKLI